MFWIFSSSMPVPCTVVRVRSSVSLPYPTWSQEPKISWWPQTLPAVVSTSRMSRWSSTTTWPKRSKITLIVSVVPGEPASMEQPSLSWPRMIRHSSTTWKLFFYRVPYRPALRNWPTIQTLNTNLELLSSADEKTRRFSPRFSWFVSRRAFNSIFMILNFLEKKIKSFLL